MPIRTEWMQETNLIIYTIKIFIISFYTYFTSIKLLNIKLNKKTFLKTLIWIIGTCLICVFIKTQVDFNSVILFSTFSLSILFTINTKSGIGYSIIVNALSSSINYCIYFISTILSFIPFSIIKIENIYTNFVVIMVIYTLLLSLVLAIKKIKYGFSFLKKNRNNNFFDILILKNQ